MYKKKLELVFKGRLDIPPTTPRRMETPGLQQGMDEEVKGWSGAGAKLAICLCKARCQKCQRVYQEDKPGASGVSTRKTLNAIGLPFCRC